MTNFQYIQMDKEPDPQDKQIIVDGMLAYHASKGHPRKTDSFSVLMKDGNEVVGAVMVGFLWNGMEIQTLWVKEVLRGKGYGSKLLQIAEAEAMKRGVNLAYTNTFTWQAPEFYKKMGYQVYGEIKDFPPGNNLTYFFKLIY